MTHAPTFWADKLPETLRSAFWGMINSTKFDGETAYCRVVQEELARALGSAFDLWTQCPATVLEQTEWMAARLLAAPAETRERIVRVLRSDRNHS